MLIAIEIRTFGTAEEKRLRGYLTIFADAAFFANVDSGDHWSVNRVRAGVEQVLH
jgi:hypothetical protein